MCSEPWLQDVTVGVTTKMMGELFPYLGKKGDMGCWADMEDELTTCGKHDGIGDLVTTIECEKHLPARVVVVYLPLSTDSNNYKLSLCEIEVYATSKNVERPIIIILSDHFISNIVTVM